MRDLVDEHVERAVKALPQIDPDVEGIVARVEKLERYLGRSMVETLGDAGLGEGEYRVLVRLMLSGPPHMLSPGDLSRELLVTTGGMTNRLERMEKAGLLTRSPDPRDRRGVVVELTPFGKERLDAAVGVQAHKEIDLIKALTPREKKTMNRLLRKLVVQFEGRDRPRSRRP
ncbi:MAG TPA: MarR family transcriptional regulator [Actinobacteria bacterium]|jgi:DNA-binding MarR family transcriptional regulator|nr:MarR family transcriptional regulator [Actinomycetota bacterium]